MVDDSKSKDEGDAAAPVETSAPQAPSSAPIDDNVLENLKKENLEMQEEIKKRELLLAKRQELRAREMLGGKGVASVPVVETPETQKKKAAIKFWEGTDVARAIEKHG
jgi:hypothetical protein